jgi:hypothetical protein
MRTPYGKECRYFYGDYYRGKQHEECRLLDSADLSWDQKLCQHCPVPDILVANACTHMELTPRLEKRLLIFSPQVQIQAYCNKCDCDVEEPRVGCGQCHPLPEIFVTATDDPDPVN